MNRRIEIPYPLLKLWCQIVLGCFFEFEVQGLEHLERVNGRAILAGNHTGYLDSALLLASCKRRFRFIMAEEVLGWGFIGKIVRHANVLILPARNEKRALVEVLQLLRDETCICIFPEGKLTRDGKMNEFQEGAAYLQMKSGAPIIPFAISGGFEAWPHGRRIPRFGKVVLRFGAPLYFDETLGRADITSRLAEKVARMKERLDRREPVARLPQSRNVVSPLHLSNKDSA